MEIYTHLNLDDFIEYNEYHYKTKTSFLQKNIRWLLFGIFLIYFLTSLNRPIPEDLTDWGNLVIILFVFVIMYGLDIFNSKIRKAQVKKFIKKNPNQLGKMKVELNKEKVITFSDNSKYEVQTGSIRSIEENNDYYYIYLNSMSAIILPKKDIQDNEEFISFAQEIGHSLTS